MRVVTSDQLRQFTADEAALSRGGLGGMKREAPPSVADDDKRRLVVLPYRMTVSCGRGRQRGALRRRDGQRQARVRNPTKKAMSVQPGCAVLKVVENVLGL